MTKTLVGVGVGPGDPELITIKAAKILQSADIILVPQTQMRAHQMGRAEEIVAAVAPDNLNAIVRVEFSMSLQLAERETSRSDAGHAALKAFRQGAETVAMATIGDPNVFSTFTYLAHQVRSQMPEIQVELVPGITAMQTLSAAAGKPLVIGDQVLALAPATLGESKLRQVLQTADTTVIYKGGRQISDLVRLVSQSGKVATVGAELSLPEQKIVSGKELESLDNLGYFATLMATNPHGPAVIGEE